MEWEGRFHSKHREAVMTAKRLKEFLDEEGVRYKTIKHDLTYTTAEAAASAHVSGHMVAKTVILELDGGMVMAVIPAHAHVDLAVMKDAMNARSLELVSERALEPEFPGCDLGALPPFGNLYGMPVYIDPELAECEEIAFNAGSHTELIRMAYQDFERLVHPKVLLLAAHT